MGRSVLVFWLPDVSAAVKKMFLYYNNIIVTTHPIAAIEDLVMLADEDIKYYIIINCLKG